MNDKGEGTTSMNRQRLFALINVIMTLDGEERESTRPMQSLSVLSRHCRVCGIKPRKVCRVQASMPCETLSLPTASRSAYVRLRLAVVGTLEKSVISCGHVFHVATSVGSSVSRRLSPSVSKAKILSHS